MFAHLQSWNNIHHFYCSQEFLNENNEDKFIELIDWLEEQYDWDYQENEGGNRTRFDWNGGDYSFWLNRISHL